MKKSKLKKVMSALLGKKTVKAAKPKAAAKTVKGKKAKARKAVARKIPVKRKIKSAPAKAVRKSRPAKSVRKPKITKSPGRVPKASKRVVKKAAPRAKPAAKRPAQSRLQKDQRFAQTMLQQEAVEKKAIRPYPVLEGGNSARITILLPILKELVRKGIISDWLIDLIHERSANIYVERTNVENEMSAIREDVQLTIYERFSDGTIGEAQLPIISADPAEMRERIMDAKQTCTYSKKKAFDLPEPVEGIQFPEGADEQMLHAMFEGNGAQLPRSLAAQVHGVMSSMLDVKLNSFEILTSASTVRVLNSNGIDISYRKTSIYVEFVLTAKQAAEGRHAEEREFIMYRMAVSPEQLDIQGLLLQQAQIVRDATHARLNPGYTGNVIFSGPSITEFFAPHGDLNPLVLHAFAKISHMGLSCFKRGQPLGHFNGEQITLTSNPALPLGLATAPVDLEGNPLQPVEIIRNGTFINHIATARYAQYLGVPATGMVSNIQVSPGATREEHLRGNDYFEIVSFSWFNPNPFSGDFAAEIRLGYHWRNGRKTPFRGGTFTGNVFRNILNARFSKEVTQSGEYYGPRMILFKDATITKME